MSTDNYTDGQHDRPAAVRERRILVPLDGSMLAETAVPHACALAQATGSQLVLLCVAQEPRYMNENVPSLEVIEEVWGAEPDLARAYLAGIDRKLREANKGLQVRLEVQSGDPASQILHEAERDPAVCMVVMATHGRSGLGRWVFGSVAERVLHSAQVPVVLVRPKLAHMDAEARPEVPLPEVRYHTIAVPLDGTHLSEHALEQACLLATAFEARMVLVAALTPAEDQAQRVEGLSEAWDAASGGEMSRPLANYLDGIATWLQAQGIKSATRVVRGNPAEQIAEVSEDLRADLIVMGFQDVHGRRVSREPSELVELQRPDLRSVPLEVVHGTHLPVLLLHTEARLPIVPRHGAGPLRQPVGAGR